MATEQKPYHQRVAEEVIEALKNGTAPWIKPWEPGQMPDGPINAITGKPYRGINRLNLAMQQGGHIDPRWCTYKQAQTLGAQVKKGSKGTAIQYWKFDETRPMKDDQGRPLFDDQGQPKSETVTLDRPKVFFATVFHASQIENMPPLPPRETRPEWERHQQAERLLAASNAKIFHDQANRAFYRPATDDIHLPPRDQFLSPDKYYATAFHELGHWTGHESRLNRDIRNPFGSEQYAREELRAELASYMLGADLGIGHDPGQHHAYIASWIKALEKDPREIIRAAQDAEHIKEYTMGLEHKQTQEQPTELSPIATEINRAMADLSRWDDMGAAREANKYASGALQALADGDMKWAKEALALAAEVEKENATEVGSSFTGSLALLEARTQQPQLSEEAPALGPQQMAPPPQPATEKTWLNVPFKEKNQAKELGAKWDGKAKLWYAPEGVDLQPFDRWLDKEKAPAADAPVLNPQEEFGQFLREAGLVLDGAPIMDGKKHRAQTNQGSPGAKDSVYCGYEDGRPNGWFQNFKAGTKGKWIATGQVVSPAHRAELKKEVSEQLTETEQARRSVQEKAQKRAYARWMNAEPVQGHNYFEQKGIENLGLRLDKQGNLLVPAYDLDTGRIQTLQHISPTGGKWYEKDCPKRGAVYMLPPEEDKEKETPEIVLMAEGYATGASLHQATGLPVAIAFDAGNLKEAALAIRKKLPNAAITICADNDHKHPSGHNVGVDKAKEAAAAVGGKVLVPELTKNEKEKGLTDFNDLHRSRGLDAVAKVVGYKAERVLEAETAEVEM